jgi:DNA modification methylase
MRLKLDLNSPDDYIKETDTLNARGGFLGDRQARGQSDTRHICPLQLGLIERLVRLYTNPGELVLDPFSGIGSTGVMALKLGRRYYGCELKDEYHRASLVNLDRALRQREQDARDLFSSLPTEGDSNG